MGTVLTPGLSPQPVSGALSRAKPRFGMARMEGAWGLAGRRTVCRFFVCEVNMVAGHAPSHLDVMESPVFVSDAKELFDGTLA